MFHYKDESPITRSEASAAPVSALCLRVPGTDCEELVVHREGENDFVFLFEALDDAYTYAVAAHRALGFAPEIGRVQIADLHFRTARFKPAVGEYLDFTISRH